MNMSLKLDLDYKKWLPALRQSVPYIFGVFLVGVFGYTAYTVNASLNISSSTVAAPAASPAANITFDKKAIQSVKNLSVVQGSVPTGSLGKEDPFK